MDFEENLGFWAFSRDIVIPSLWQGIGLTVELLAISGILGILLGFLVAFARISRRPWFIFSSFAVRRFCCKFFLSTLHCRPSSMLLWTPFQLEFWL